MKKDDPDKTEDYDTLQSLCNNIRSTSREDRPRQLDDRAIKNNFIKVDNYVSNEFQNLKLITQMNKITDQKTINKMNEEDLLKIVHMQASHLENLVSYVEMANQQIDK